LTQCPRSSGNAAVKSDQRVLAPTDLDILGLTRFARGSEIGRDGVPPGLNGKGKDTNGFGTPSGDEAPRRRKNPDEPICRHANQRSAGSTTRRRPAIYVQVTSDGRWREVPYRWDAALRADATCSVGGGGGQRNGRGYAQRQRGQRDLLVDWGHKHSVWSEVARYSDRITRTSLASGPVPSAVGSDADPSLRDRQARRGAALGRSYVDSTEIETIPGSLIP
jgi:hypothetical protein